MKKEKLTDIAIKFHQAIVTAKKNRAFHYYDRMSRFPFGCCDDVADLFAHYLYHEYGIISLRVDGSYYDENSANNCSHSWQEIGDLIIDLTGSQFINDPVLLNYSKEVYVGSIDEFHMLFEIDNRKPSRGIEDLNERCWGRMNGLYKNKNPDLHTVCKK